MVSDVSGATCQSSNGWDGSMKSISRRSSSKTKIPKSSIPAKLLRLNLLVFGDFTIYRVKISGESSELSQSLSFQLVNS